MPGWHYQFCRFYWMSARLSSRILPCLLLHRWFHHQGDRHPCLQWMCWLQFVFGWWLKQYQPFQLAFDILHFLLIVNDNYSVIPKRARKHTVLSLSASISVYFYQIKVADEMLIHIARALLRYLLHTDGASSRNLPYILMLTDYNQCNPQHKSE